MVIGAAAVLLYHAIGRIAGVSGIFFTGIKEGGLWRGLFLVGIVLGAGLGAQQFPTLNILTRPNPGFWILAASGLLVGWGTRQGGGCTGLWTRTPGAPLAGGCARLHGGRCLHGEPAAPLAGGAGMRSNLAALVAGLLFGFGLMLSGMSNPGEVLSFLDWSGVWSPDLMGVLGSAALDEEWWRDSCFAAYHCTRAVRRTGRTRRRR